MTKLALTATLTTVMAAGFAPAAAAQDVPQIEISFNTTYANIPLNGTEEGYYRPDNVVAVWVSKVEADVDTFVKSVFVTNSVRSVNLTEHLAQMPPDDIDGISGATRRGHDDPVVVDWDVTDIAAASVANGEYVLHLELADSESAQGIGSNNYAEVPFTIDGTEGTQELLDTNGFSDISVTYQLVPAPQEPPPDEPPSDDSVPGEDETASPDGTTVGGACSATGTSVPPWAALALAAMLGVLVLPGRKSRRRSRA